MVAVESRALGASSLSARRRRGLATLNTFGVERVAGRVERVLAHVERVARLVFSIFESQLISERATRVTGG